MIRSDFWFSFLRLISSHAQAGVSLKGLLLAGIILQGISSTLPATDPSKPTGPKWVGKDAPTNLSIEQSLQRQMQAMMDGMSDDAKEGFKHLTESVYLPSDYDEEVMGRLDKVRFPLPLSDIELAEGSREATWLRFGLSLRPRFLDRKNEGALDEKKLPLQYVVTEQQNYVMNCFACHGGNLFGVTYPGSPNTLYALETLTENVRRAKLTLNKPFGHMDVGSMAMPLGTTVGTSNAVMFGVALMNYRDADLNVDASRDPAPLTNHDMDAPPWWHFHLKHHLYIDGFAQRGHRGLMQFMMVKQNGPAQFQAWEKDFEKVYAFLMELRPPKYPMPIDDKLAETGRTVFEGNCASCHGTYGVKIDYPEKRIAWDEIGTDRVRLDALSVEHRDGYGKSWFAHHGQQTTFAEVDGYVAPPLTGVWASAPYLHNGSVPTLWHLLHPEERPQQWRRERLGLDTEKMGLKVSAMNEIPKGTSSAERRWYFDTRKEGKSASGHDYPNSLTEDEKVALLEYLKTL